MEIEQDPKQTALLFEKGCVIPKVQTLTFKKNEGIKFTLFYDPVIKIITNNVKKFYFIIISGPLRSRLNYQLIRTSSC